jgi:hypothetical protein
MLDNIHLKITFFSRNIFHFTQRKQLDIDMPADLDQFWGKNSHGTIIRGKGLIQLGHDPPDTW